MRRVPLGEVATIVSGATPKTGVADYWGGDISWATPADLSKLSGPYIDSTPRNITASGLASCATAVLPVGSVLLSSRAPIGHVAINTVPMATNQGFKSLVPKSGQLEAKYLYHWLRSQTSLLQSLGNGATFKEVSKATVARIEIPVPTLERQRRIASILDEADALRAKRSHVRAHLRSLVGSTFFAMFGDESWRAVTTSPPKGGPHDRKWVMLTDVAQMATGHTPDRNRSDYWDGNIPWISLPEIRALDGRIANVTSLHVAQEGIDHSSAVVLPAGTVCFSRTASIGFVTMMGRPMSTSQDFHNWVPGPELGSEYLMAALRVSRTHLLGNCDGSTHKTIYQRVAEGFRILLPRLEQQDVFARRMAGVRALEASVERALVAEDELFTSLQARAFQGELR